MISKTIKAFCATPELIENYNKAIADTTQTWDCHHRMEEYYTKAELIEMEEYYNVGPDKLIFLTKVDHSKQKHKAKTENAGNKVKSGLTKEERRKWQDKFAGALMKRKRASKKITPIEARVLAWYDEYISLHLRKKDILNIE